MRVCVPVSLPGPFPCSPGMVLRYNLERFFDQGLRLDDGGGDSILHPLGHHLLHYGGQGLGNCHIWNHHVMIHLSQNQCSEKFISYTGNIFARLGNQIKAQDSRNYTSHKD